MQLIYKRIAVRLPSYSGGFTVGGEPPNFLTLLVYSPRRNQAVRYQCMHQTCKKDMSVFATSGITFHNFRYLNDKQLAAHLRDMDLVIPFGNRV